MGAAGLFALCLIGAPVSLRAQQGQSPSVVSGQREWLLGQIRIGEATNRDNLVQDSLARLRLLAPNDPDTLLASIRVALHRKQRDEAEGLLKRLQQVAPASPQLARAARLFALSSDENQAQLQQARLLAVAGNDQKALAIYQRLFGDQPPDFALAAEYWRLRSTQPGQRRLAIARLMELDRQYPGNPALRQNLLNLLHAEERSRDAAALTQKMAADPATREIAAQAEMDRLQDLPVSDASVRGWREFVARYPQSPLRAEAQEILERQQRIVSDPAWRIGQRGLALLERGDNAGAEAALRQALRRQPQESQWLGNLGLALLRQGHREEALDYFQRAQRAEQNPRQVGKWHDLVASTRYWMLLAQAEKALAEGRVGEARTLYEQARRQEPGDANALVGLADVAQAEGDDAEAERLLRRASRLAPNEGSVVRGLVRLYAQRDSDELERYVAGLPPALRQTYAQAVRDARRERLVREADEATAAGDAPRALTLLQQAAELAPADPWLTFRVAGMLRDAGRPEDGDRAFARLFEHVAADDSASRYAQALYLASTDRTQPALDALAKVPQAKWDGDMRALADRLEKQQLLARADRLREQGQEADAIALLHAYGEDRDVRLRLAGWAEQRADLAGAVAIYEQLLQKDPDDSDARLGLIEARIDQGEQAEAARLLRERPPVFPDDQIDAQRRLADAWADIGERDRALVLLRALEARQPAPDALLRRDLARLLAADAPDQALDMYALAMRDDGLLSPSQAAPRDDRALTRATRENDADDWLRRSLRSDVEALYQRRNPTLTLYNDTSWRDDGTPGLSRLRGDTRIANLDLPWGDGQAFLRVEQVAMDAGRFETDAQGAIDEDVGSCRLELVDAEGREVPLPACTATGRQKDSGVGVAAGWQSADGDLAFDFGHSPAGFAVRNWYGGATVDGDLGVFGWSLTASRRPMTNSLLSYAGMTDPRTGQRWGGVTANGVTLGVNYDEGGRNGVWSSFGWHRLLGENVADNDRMRAMAGWYHRLIRRADMRLDVGASAMYWRYDRDLGGYSLGQGGYYSPQRYVSVGLPIDFAWRDDNWSLRVDASLSWSQSRTSDSQRYPLPRLLDGLMNSLGPEHGQVFIEPNIQPIAGGRSQGTGYRLRAIFERRLSDHFVLGMATTLQRSRDFSPNNAMVYLRYTFEPWQGNLPLPPTPPVPYGEFR